MCIFILIFCFLSLLTVVWSPIIPSQYPPTRHHSIQTTKNYTATNVTVQASSDRWTSRAATSTPATATTTTLRAATATAKKGTTWEWKTDTGQIETEYQWQQMFTRGWTSKVSSKVTSGTEQKYKWNTQDKCSWLAVTQIVFGRASWSNATVAGTPGTSSDAAGLPTGTRNSFTLLKKSWLLKYYKTSDRPPSKFRFLFIW